MSYQDFQKAIKLAQTCKGYRVRGFVPDEVLIKAEELVGFNFSTQNYEYLRDIGYLSFFGNEFFGITKDDFSGSHHGNMIESTITDRKDKNLPKDWVTLYFFDDGYYGYLDYSDLDRDKEPPVIMAYHDGNEYKIIKKIANDFGEFLLVCVERSLDDSQNSRRFDL
jgi:hypothetical protein